MKPISNTRYPSPSAVTAPAVSLDVPSPIDLRAMPDALAWAETALVKRPCRPQFFARYVEEVQSASLPVRRVLELGSGPGFLIEHLLRAIPSVDYVAMDFSAAMHQLAQDRLGPPATRVQWIERSFLVPDWGSGLGSFEAVVTHQAVHELRHKRRAMGLHQQVRGLLQSGGMYLVCDHHTGEGGMRNEQLYMSVSEQAEALRDAGFASVELILQTGGMALHRAINLPTACSQTPTPSERRPGRSDR